MTTIVKQINPASILAGEVVNMVTDLGKYRLRKSRIPNAFVVEHGYGLVDKVLIQGMESDPHVSIAIVENGQTTVGGVVRPTRRTGTMEFQSLSDAVSYIMELPTETAPTKLLGELQILAVSHKCTELCLKCPCGICTAVCGGCND